MCVRFPDLAGNGRSPPAAERSRCGRTKAVNCSLRVPDGRIMAAGCTSRGDSFAAARPRVWSDRKIVVRGYNWIMDVSPDAESGGADSAVGAANLPNG